MQRRSVRNKRSNCRASISVRVNVSISSCKYILVRVFFDQDGTKIFEVADANFILKYDAYLKQVINPEKYPGQFTLVQLPYSGSEGYINTRLKSVSQPRIEYKLSAIPYDGKQATSLLFIIYCYK